MDECEARASERPHRSAVFTLIRSTDQGRGAVARERHGLAEASLATILRARDLPTHLTPRRPAAPEGPRGAFEARVARPADQRRVTVARQRDAAPEVSEFAAFDVRQRRLLQPRVARAREHPGGAALSRRTRIADQRGFPVGRQRDALAEAALSVSAVAPQHRASGPRARAAREDP